LKSIKIIKAFSTKIHRVFGKVLSEVGSSFEISQEENDRIFVFCSAQMILRFSLRLLDSTFRSTKVNFFLWNSIEFQDHSKKISIFKSKKKVVIFSKEKSLWSLIQDLIKIRIFKPAFKKIWDFQTTSFNKN